MNKYKILSGIAVIVLVVILVGKITISPTPQAIVTGSVTRANEYLSTTTDSNWNTPALTVGGFKLLACGEGSLGSIIIQNDTAGAFTLYDGTTTNSHNMHATTTLAKAYANQAENAYPYDSVFRYGLIAEFQTPNVASSTITYRGNIVCQ